MQPTKQTLYIGIIVREDTADVISTGTDFQKVYESTGQAWSELESTAFTRFYVTETPMPTVTPIEPPLPEWYTNVIKTVSITDIASHVVDCWDMHTLVDNAVLSTTKYYEDPDSLMEDLENGYIIPELEKDSNGEYDPEYLKELAEENDRDLQEYKDNDTLVILDALRANF
tara:strand:- start:79 stop:591 length:513 start_codon:yes stop_codon:yes gene_type:complete